MNRPQPRRDTDRDRAGVTVRQAETADAAGIAAIYNHHVDAGGATFDTEHWTIDRVQQFLQVPEPDGWLVAIESGRIVGWVSARRYSLRHGYRFTCESAIYLDPVAMGRGIADQLQLGLEDHCRRCGIHHAVARITADNRRSIAFHRRYGYELVGIQKEVGKMDGAWVDVAILQRIFESA